MKVLIADDSRSMRKMVQAILEEAGYEVVVTEDGQQAWDALCKAITHTLTVSQNES